MDARRKRKLRRGRQLYRQQLHLLYLRRSPAERIRFLNYSTATWSPNFSWLYTKRFPRGYRDRSPMTQVILTFPQLAAKLGTLAFGPGLRLHLTITLL